MLQQGNVFMAAGFETTAVTLAFTVFLLATNPEAEAKLLKEIDRVGRDFMPTYKNAGDWPYALVRSCLSERSLRRANLASELVIVVLCL